MMLLPDWSCLCKATFLKEKRSCFEMAQVPWLNPTTQTNTCTQTSARTHIQKQTHTHTSPPVWAPQLFLLGMCVIWIARARTKSTWLGKISASRKISMKGNKYQIFHNMFSRTQENIHVNWEKPTRCLLARRLTLSCPVQIPDGKCIRLWLCSPLWLFVTEWIWAFVKKKENKKKKSQLSASVLPIKNYPSVYSFNMENIYFFIILLQICNNHILALFCSILIKIVFSRYADDTQLCLSTTK